MFGYDKAEEFAAAINGAKTMTYPEDVLKAAREAAARYWGTLDAADSGEGYDENARLCRSGECDADPEVQSACIAIMAERQRCAGIASRMEIGGIVETPEFITAILGQQETGDD